MGPGTVARNPSKLRLSFPCPHPFLFLYLCPFFHSFFVSLPQKGHFCLSLSRIYLLPRQPYLKVCLGLFQWKIKKKAGWGLLLYLEARRRGNGYGELARGHARPAGNRRGLERIIRVIPHRRVIKLVHAGRGDLAHGNAQS